MPAAVPVLPPPLTAAAVPPPAATVPPPLLAPPPPLLESAPTSRLMVTENASALVHGLGTHSKAWQSAWLGKQVPDERSTPDRGKSPLNMQECVRLYVMR